jgi:DNA helicase-2/ATP-dependent DNA helicase PcrA
MLFSRIKDCVKIHTLNQWGYSYLRNSEKNISVKSSKQEKGSLIKNTLRPVWLNHPLVGPTLESCKDKPAVIDIFDKLKSSGFQHNLSLQAHFILQIEWLKENGLERYFERTIKKDLEDLGLLNLKAKTLFGQFEPFLRFWVDACDHLWKSAIITLEDQKYWALLKLSEKYRTNFFPEPNRYHHIMVDEFQDINPLDLSLINRLVKANKSTLTISGDDDQAIFEWRGSTPSFILRPDAHFGEKFQTFELAKNYRSPHNIVAISQNLISHNKNRENKVFPECHRKDDAEIIPRTFDSHIDSLDLVIDLAIKANRTGKPKQLAIISRKKSQIIPIQILLASKDIPYFAKEDLNVLLSNAFEDLKEILYTVFEKNSRKNSRDVVDALIRCCNYVGYYGLNKDEVSSLYNFLIAHQPKNFMEALREFKNYKGSLRFKVHEYFDAINQVIESKTVADAIQQIGIQFRGMKQHYGKSEDDIFYKDPPFFYLAEFARRYHNDFEGFIDQVEKVIRANSKSVDENSEDIDPDLRFPIHIMTALRAKGKEFETVVLLDVNDQIWPNKLAEGDAALEQERRIFYVAVTRPKNKLVLLTVKSFGKEAAKPSPYISEMKLNSTGSKLPAPIKEKRNLSVSGAKHIGQPTPSHQPSRTPASPQAVKSKAIPPAPKNKKLSDVENNSTKNLLPSDVTRIGRVFQLCTSFDAEWVDWEVFRANLLKQYPDFLVSGTSIFKSKTFVKLYAELIESKHDEKRTNIVYVRMKRKKPTVIKTQSYAKLPPLKPLPNAIKRAFNMVFEENLLFSENWLPLQAFRHSLYRVHPDFDDLLHLHGFENLEHALGSEPGFIEFVQDKQLIHLRRNK